jgi:hypothetical protein
MAKALQSQKIAVLMANGFNEQDFLTIQKAMIEQGATLKIISTDSGLVNGWDGKGWGHNFAIDAQLNSALGIDYDALIIPGGQRSHDKLKLTAHSRRFIGSFLAAMKPVMCMGDAVQLMAHTDHLSGKTVSMVFRSHVHGRRSVDRRHKRTKPAGLCFRGYRYDGPDHGNNETSCIIKGIGVMKAEIEAVVGEINESLVLLRRHL